MKSACLLIKNYEVRPSGENVMRKFLRNSASIFLLATLSVATSVVSVGSLHAQELDGQSIQVPNSCAQSIQELNDALTDAIDENKALSEINKSNRAQIEVLSAQLEKAIKAKVRKSRNRRR